MTELTDAECDAFRALPLDFNGMVRAIYAAGAARSADTSGAVLAERERCATICMDFYELVSGGAGCCAVSPGYRLEQAARRIREGRPANGWYAMSTQVPEPPPAAPGGPAGARRPDENSPSGPSDRAGRQEAEPAGHERALLELAAKAAVLEVVLWQIDGCPNVTLPGGTVSRRWNPLHDDGDALRLAVQCGIEVSTVDDDLDSDGRFTRACAGYATESDPRIRYVFEDHRGDLFAATRRAIVRAAAAIGSELQQTASGSSRSAGSDEQGGS